MSLENTLSESTPITLSLVLGLVGSGITLVFVGYRYLRDQFETIRREFTELRHEVQSMRESQNAAWTEDAMRIWALELASKNPTLSLPDIHAIISRHRGSDR